MLLYQGCKIQKTKVIELHNKVVSVLVQHSCKYQIPSVWLHKARFHEAINCGVKPPSSSKKQKGKAFRYEKYRVVSSIAKLHFYLYAFNKINILLTQTSKHLCVCVGMSSESLESEH